MRFPATYKYFLCVGSDQEEVHYKYQLTVIHGKSEYSYKGPVISLMRSANEVSREKKIQNILGEKYYI